MRYLARQIGVGAALLCAAGAAGATVTLQLGNNHLASQIHADPSMPQNGTTVFGLTKPGNVGVSFQSSTQMHITGGSGYAQISDNTPANTPLNNLSVYLTNGGGFTGYEFTIQYGSHDVGKNTPALLTIGYDLVGGGGGAFTYNANDAVRQNLRFTGSAATDFQLLATNGDVLSRVYLLSTARFDQIKQNDINVAPQVGAVPEPSTWATMLLGFGLMGAGYRRQSRRKLALSLSLPRSGIS